MQVLSAVQCEEWLSSHGYRFDIGRPFEAKEGHVTFPAAHYHRKFLMLTSMSARTQLLLSRHLARWIRGDETILWVTSWALYTPEEMEVFLNFRQSFGEERRLIEAPGHLFPNGNQEAVAQLASLLLLMMAFNWEGFVMSGDRNSIIWMADEILEISAHDKDRTDEFGASVRGLGIVELPLPLQ